MRLEIPFKHIHKLVDYLYHDEEKHFYENYEYIDEESKIHIFYDVLMVSNWLNIIENLKFFDETYQ